LQEGSQFGDDSLVWAVVVYDMIAIHPGGTADIPEFDVDFKLL